jgi:hypothetical protein
LCTAITPHSSLNLSSIIYVAALQDRFGFVFQLSVCCACCLPLAFFCRCAPLQASLSGKHFSELVAFRSPGNSGSRLDLPKTNY